MAENVLVGKVIHAVQLSSDNKAIRFLTDAGEIVARADGDCCSSTWIESLDAPELLLGTVLEVEDVPMPDLDGGADDWEEVIAYYGFQITTDRGRCVIDYRNSSNGYYGGNIVWPGEYFYGGVYGQNISNEEWVDAARAATGKGE